MSSGASLTALFIASSATSVTIALGVFRHLSLPRGEAYPSASAAGAILGYETLIDRLAIGAITVHKVRGVILPEMDDDRTVLGMRFLRAFELRHQNRELMIIKSAP